MAQISRLGGSTSHIFNVFILDSASTVGAGKTGLTNASVVIYYKRNRDSASVAVTLTGTGTLGTYTSGLFKEIDATNMPGWYEFHAPNAAMASGSGTVSFLVTGTGIVPAPIVAELTVTDNQSTSGGLLAVPIASNLKKNTALAAFVFGMTDSTTHAPKTGVTVAATRSLDGGAFAACTNTPTEISGGNYTISLSAADLNANVVALRFTGTASDDLNLLVVTAP